jgi:hypothetical protein
VTIEGRAAKALDPEDVLEQLADHHTVVSYSGGLLSTTSTVPARTPMAAFDFLYEALSEALKGVKLDIDRVEAMTEERQEKEVEISNLPDLVGIAEIAELANTSRQRVFQMTANKNFPAAVLELRSGRLWRKPAIESYLERHPVGLRRLKTLSSQTGGRTSTAMQQKKLRPAAMKSR